MTEQFNSKISEAYNSDNINQLRRLLESIPPADINKVITITYKTGGKTRQIYPLHAAVECQLLETTESLIAKGADVNQTVFYEYLDGLGGCYKNTEFTPLMLAIMSPNIDILKLLISKGADVNIGEIAPLMLTVKDRVIYGLTKILIANNAKVNVMMPKGKDGEGMTPLWAAANHHHTDMVKLLIEKGAKLDDMPSKGQYTAINLIFSILKDESFYFDNSTELAKLLITNSTDLNFSDSEKADDPLCQGIFFKAIDLRDKELIELLIDKGVDINAPVDADAIASNYDWYDRHTNHTSNEDTPLLAAIRQMNSDEIVELLVAKNADVNISNDDGETPIMLATRRNDLELVKFLVTEGHADVNIEDDENETPLMLAIANGNFELVKFLIAQGAKINIENDHGQTMLRIATAHGHLKLVKFLVLNGAKVGDLKNENWEFALKSADTRGATKCIDFIKNAAAAESGVPLLYSAGNHKGHSKMLTKDLAKLVLKTLTGNEPKDAPDPKKPTKRDH